MDHTLRYAGLAAAACLLAASAGAQAQAQAGAGRDYPNRPVRIIVPATAGGGADIIARIVAQPLGRQLGQNVVVDNRPGAANIIGTEIAAKSAPDGYTLFIGTTGTFTTNPHIYAKLPYSEKDFDTISNMVDAPFLLSVHPSVPARVLSELLALARARPAQLTYASFGMGSSSHLAAELFQSMAQVKLVHVPYKGSAPGMADLVAGHVAMTFDTALASLGHIGSKRIRPLGSPRSGLKLVADVPTFGELGLKGYEAGSWYGLMAPAGTPKDILVKLHGETVKALRQPEVAQRLTDLGADILATTAEEFTAQLRRDYEKWGRVVKAAGLKPE